MYRFQTIFTKIVAEGIDKILAYDRHDYRRDQNPKTVVCIIKVRGRKRQKISSLLVTIGVHN